MADDRVHDVLERLWPGREPVVEVLSGGITNHNLKVTLGEGEAYVVRIAGQHTGLLGIDRRVEYEASLAAAAVGVGPEVITLVEPEGYLVTRFIAGDIVPLERMRDLETVRRVARALRAVHAAPPLSGRFDSFRIVEEYRATAFSRGAEVPSEYVWARQTARRVAVARGPVPERPCHNDLLNANFIDDGSRIRIVDWEYAGMGDVFFDLANFSINHELDAEGRAVAPRRVLRRRAAPARARHGADAVHVGLPRSDVGGGAGRCVGRRFRLRRLRGAALRTARADRRRAGVPGCAGGLIRAGESPLGVPPLRAGLRDRALSGSSGPCARRRAPPRSPRRAR